MSYFNQEYMLSPLVVEFFKVLEDHYGQTNGMRKVSLNYNDVQDAAKAAVVIYAALAAGNNQSKKRCAMRIGMNRNTLNKVMRANEYLSQVDDALFPSEKQDLYALKCKMGLARHA